VRHAETPVVSLGHLADNEAMGISVH
jgi:hypothetical protein